VAEWDEAASAYRTTLAVKLGVVAVSGAAAAVHARARTPTGLAVFGVLSAGAAVAAVLFGVLLGTHVETGHVS
jgi:hypothetical protein